MLRKEEEGGVKKNKNTRHITFKEGDGEGLEGTKGNARHGLYVWRGPGWEGRERGSDIATKDAVSCNQGGGLGGWEADTNVRAADGMQRTGRGHGREGTKATNRCSELTVISGTRWGGEGHIKIKPCRWWYVRKGAGRKRGGDGTKR